jgi:glyoxylase-like metal-dependent hydrolase (beta-lactamase superfamily II)
VSTQTSPRTTPSARIERLTIPVTPFQQNCSLVWCRATRRGTVIDPGGDLGRIVDAIARHQVSVDKVLLTHAHLDHASGARVLADQLGVKIEGPQREDLFWLEAIPQQGARYGFPPTAAFTPDRWLEDGDEVTFGEQRMTVLHCPGHTPGHVVFHHADGVAFVGDVLFRGSVGRSDFPRGDHGTLVRSIRHKLWPLGDGVVFVPGHGPESTFGFERRTNPFVGDALFD